MSSCHFYDKALGYKITKLPAQFTLYLVVMWTSSVFMTDLVHSIRV